MSRHSYVTTTVEYYEYITPHTPCYNYESIFRPFPVAISTPYIDSPHSFADYSYDLPLSSDFAGFCLLGRQGGHIFDTPEYELEPAIYAYRRQEQLEEPHRTHYECESESESEQEEVNQPEDLHKNSESKAETLKTSKSIEPKEKKKKNVYQAEQGYIVEEPTSEDGQE